MEQIPIEEATMEQMDMSEGGCGPQRLLARSIDHWREELTLQQVPGRTCDPVGEPHWSSLFLKNCSP